MAFKTVYSLIPFPVVPSVRRFWLQYPHLGRTNCFRRLNLSSTRCCSTLILVEPMGVAVLLLRVEPRRMVYQGGLRARIGYGRGLVQLAYALVRGFIISGANQVSQLTRDNAPGFSC